MKLPLLQHNTYVFRHRRLHFPYVDRIFQRSWKDLPIKVFVIQTRRRTKCIWLGNRNAMVDSYYDQIGNQFS